jgi:hypothetical protein
MISHSTIFKVYLKATQANRKKYTNNLNLYYLSEGR